MNKDTSNSVLYSDYFSVYPWVITSDDNNMVVSNLSLISYYDAEKISGHTDPTIPEGYVTRNRIDRPLLESLIKQWKIHYSDQHPKWKSACLFRSLNMAFHASLLPGKCEATIQDYGRLLSLWVSAFEILAHPGGNQQVSRAHVRNLIDKCQHYTKKFSYKRYKPILQKTTHKNTKPSERISYPSRIYDNMVQARNDFLHGNPVDRNSVFFKGTNNYMAPYSSMLYRVALSGFLGLQFNKPIPSKDRVEEFSRFISERMDFNLYRASIEQGLLLARQKKVKTRKI